MGLKKFQKKSYLTDTELIDPRLNATQALELAFLISQELKKTQNTQRKIAQAAS